MNALRDTAAEAKLTAAAPTNPETKGRGLKPLTHKDRRLLDDVTDWMAEQDDAEVEFLLAEVANKNRRAGRRMGWW